LLHYRGVRLADLLLIVQVSQIASDVIVGICIGRRFLTGTATYSAISIRVGIGGASTMAACSPLKLQSLNHISRACNDVEETALWYQRVLGFVKIERPSSLNCEGIW
jgi:hypothetical protein